MHGESAAATTVKELLAQARRGRGGALLLRGDPGMGASTLLDSAADGFPGTVLRTRGVVAETEVPFSGLHALLFPLGPQPDVPALDPARLAVPSADAGTAVRPEPAALLELLAQLSARRPVLCCVDDVHLLDRPSREVLGFAARRLRPVLPVAMLLVLPHDRPADPWLAGLREVTLPPLPETAAARLVAGLLPADTDPAVREAVLCEGRGNPGLLTDLATRLAAGSPPAAFPHPLPLDGERLRACAARLRALPRATRRLLLLAAAQQGPMEPASPRAAAGPAPADLDLLARAAEAEGLDLADLAPAEREYLVAREGDTVRLAHRLLHRAAYWGASPAERRSAHRALAAAVREPRHHLWSLWHRQAAADGADPELSRSLAEAAHTAPADLRVPPGDALLAAARLTDDAGARAGHLTAAAAHVWADGRPHRARALLDAARRLPAAAVVRGRAELLRGVLELHNGVVTDAREVLLAAARLLSGDDPAAAYRALLGAADACWAVGDVTGYAAALARMAEVDASARVAALLRAHRIGMTAVMRGSIPDAVAPLRRVLRLAEREDDPERLILAAGAALVLGEVVVARDLATRAVAAARAQGATVVEPRALERLVYTELRSGRHAQAAAHARTGLALALRTGQRNCAAHHHAVLAMVASVQGDEPGCREHAEAAGADAGPHGLGMAATLAQWALARCDLGRGRPEEAASRLEPLVRPGPTPAGAGQGHFALRMLAVPCYVEAAVLAGTPEATREVLAEFVDWTADTADPQAAAQLARCRALLAESVSEATALFGQALAAHAGAEDEFEQGRTQLLHGMMLRRRRRPGQARRVLREALIAFERCGAGVWAEQARSELRATGSATGGAVDDEHRAGLPELTPQQLRIARCVAEGATNREVAVRLSVSPRTVDHHLRNVFATLGVRSRVELTRVLAAAGES